MSDSIQPPCQSEPGWRTSGNALGSVLRRLGPGGTAQRGLPSQPKCATRPPARYAANVRRHCRPTLSMERIMGLACFPHSSSKSPIVWRPMPAASQKPVFDLDVELYLKDHEIRDFATEHRTLTHAQIELIAGRVSALNGCYY